MEQFTDASHTVTFYSNILQVVHSSFSVNSTSVETTLNKSRI